MHRNKVSRCIVCDSVDDMIKTGITQIYEDRQYYYILCKKEDFYDNGMYKVDKRTEEISFIMFPVFITQIKDGTTPVNVSEFIVKRRMRSC
ncbi:MAG: hypothetical protein NC120_07225 [Ruminococcus sp.]|nr:hypothetical protein [Ruminococcus sp.]